MFVPCINDDKYTLLSNRCTNIQFVDTIRVIIKYLKIFKSAPICFGSQGIHHQAALTEQRNKIFMFVPCINDD